MYPTNKTKGYGTSISNSGVTTGFTQGVGANNPRGWIYTGGTGGTFTDLKTGGVPGVTANNSSYACAINSSNWVTGLYTNGTVDDPFLYSNRSGTWQAEDIGYYNFGFDSGTVQAIGGVSTAPGR